MTRASTLTPYQTQVDSLFNYVRGRIAGDCRFVDPDPISQNDRVDRGTSRTRASMAGLGWTMTESHFPRQMGLIGTGTMVRATTNVIIGQAGNGRRPGPWCRPAPSGATPKEEGLAVPPATPDSTSFWGVSVTG
jgi:hypothetical protein